MSVFHENMLIGASGQVAAGGISRSLRFNSSDSAYLSRTPASAGNRKTWTWAGWVKRAALGGGQNIFGATRAASTRPNCDLFFSSSDNIEALQFNGSGYDFRLITNAVFRDTSAWYHIVFAIDTTQGTSANRAKLYVNGVEQSLSTASYPGPSADLEVNNNVIHNIGRLAFNSSDYFNGYLADVHFIDGQALTPSSFTEVSATTGQLIPKAYTGSYGTNGFRLSFSDNSGTTSTTLGKDAAGSNNWTPNNFSVASGSGNDSLVDTPTSFGSDTGVGGEVRGNYAVLLDQYVTDKTRLTMANGNLDVTFNNSGSSSSALSSIGVSSGKWYSEFTCTQTGSNYAFVGIASPKNNNIDSLGYGDSYAYVSNTGNKANNGSFVSYGATWTANDVIGVALDLDAGTITFYKNGVSQGQAYSSISGTYIIGCTGFLNWKFSANFGQRPFAYTAPSGFKALCDTNLPAPVVAKPSTVMDVKLYTGNGGTQTISGLGFSPDLIWIKSRSAAYDHQLGDTVRGVTNILHSNLTAAESTLNTITGTSSDGFTVSAASFIGTNANGQTFAAWTWDAGSSTVTNTQGSITSSVRANASAGFSIVTWVNGNNTSPTANTLGHGLGVIPHLVIVKSRTSGTAAWAVKSEVFSNPVRDELYLNSTAAKTTAGVDLYYRTNTVLGFRETSIGGNGDNMVAYCFAPVAGYSNGFSFSGSGSADGPFCFLGFRPRLILLKRSDSTGNWILLDTAREGYNVDNDPLWPNLADAEGTTDLIDITSNGFKVRSTDASVNASGGTYIGFAWAESPFNYARAR